jgi:hypothetical protein
VCEDRADRAWFGEESDQAHRALAAWAGERLDRVDPGEQFFSCCDPDVLTRSVDGGQSFEKPVPMATSPTFGTLAVEPDGMLEAS